MCRLAKEKGVGQMKSFLSVLWGLLTAWTVVSAFTEFSMLGIFRAIATLAIVAVCIWKNSIPDVNEWATLILAAAVIVILWQLVPGFPLSVALKNQVVREFTFYGAVLFSLIRGDE